MATGDLNKFKYNKYDISEIYNKNIKKVKLEPIDKDWGIKSKRKIPFYHETLPENKNNINNTKTNSVPNIISADNSNNVFITGGDLNLNEIQEILETNNNISEIKLKNNSSIKLNNSISTNYHSRSRQLNSNVSKQLNSYSKT